MIPSVPYRKDTDINDASKNFETFPTKNLDQASQDLVSQDLVSQDLVTPDLVTLGQDF